MFIVECWCQGIYFEQNAIDLVSLWQGSLTDIHATLMQISVSSQSNTTYFLSTFKIEGNKVVLFFGLGAGGPSNHCFK